MRYDQEEPRDFTSMRFPFEPEVVWIRASILETVEGNIDERTRARFVNGLEAFIQNPTAIKYIAIIFFYLFRTHSGGVSWNLIAGWSGCRRKSAALRSKTGIGENCGRKWCEFGWWAVNPGGEAGGGNGRRSDIGGGEEEEEDDENQCEGDCEEIVGSWFGEVCCWWVMLAEVLERIHWRKSSRFLEKKWQLSSLLWRSSNNNGLMEKWIINV